jgi:hypothetical protein
MLMTQSIGGNVFFHLFVPYGTGGSTKMTGGLVKHKKKASHAMAAAAIVLALTTMTGTQSFAAAYQKSVVVRGTETPWLFFDADDGQAMETYRRINLFTQPEMERIGSAINSFASDLNAEGIKFIFMIAPDKEEVYGPDYLPASYTVADNEGCTMQFINYMHENYPNVSIVYPLEEMKAAKHEFEGVDSLYFKTDTHWNFVGGYVGARALMQELSKSFHVRQNSQSAGARFAEESAETSSKVITAGSAAETAGSSAENSSGRYPIALEDKTFIVAGERPGDLQKMAGLGAAYTSIDYYPENGFALENLQVKYVGTDPVYRKTVSKLEDPAQINLWIVGDSFRNGVCDYLAETMAQATIINRYYFDPDMALQDHPDIIVYELVERYLHQAGSIPGYNTVAKNLP